MTEQVTTAPRRSTKLVFWWAFAALCLVFGAWLIANPLTAAPDEPAHITKAGGVVRGQLTGRAFDSERPSFGHVDVPAVVGFTTQIPNCFAFHPDRPASCTPAFPADAAPIVQAVTTASNYNPTYYALVGLPSLVPTGAVTIFVMRAVSALLCALALAWAFAQAGTSRRPDWPSLGVLVAMTPMVVYMSSAVNPASLEMTAAVALWTSFSVLVRDPDPSRLRSRAAAFAIIGSVFVNLRGLSPLFLAVIVATVMISAPWRNTWNVVRDRRAWPWMSLLGVATAAALMWIRVAGSLDSDGIVHHPDLTFAVAAQWSLGDTTVYLSNMAGQFGWVDTNLPHVVLATIGVVVGLLVLLALVAGDLRERLALGLLATFTIAAPVVIHASQAKYIGIVWQGRYFLPAAVGLPILAGFVLARAFGVSGYHVAWRATTLFSITWAGYQAVAFMVNWHRYAYGASHGWRTPPTNAWHTPVNIGALALALLIGLAGLVVLCVRAARRDPAEISAQDDSTQSDPSNPAPENAALDAATTA